MERQPAYYPVSDADRNVYELDEDTTHLKVFYQDGERYIMECILGGACELEVYMHAIPYSVEEEADGTTPLMAASLR